MLGESAAFVSESIGLLIRVRNNFAVRIGDIFLGSFARKRTNRTGQERIYKTMESGVFAGRNRRCGYTRLQLHRRRSRSRSGSRQLVANRRRLGRLGVLCETCEAWSASVPSTSQFESVVLAFT